MRYFQPEQYDDDQSTNQNCLQFRQETGMCDFVCVLHATAVTLLHIVSCIVAIHRPYVLRWHKNINFHCTNQFCALGVFSPKLVVS